MISSAAEQQISAGTVRPVCTTNSQSEENLIPDLNIAHIPEEDAPGAATAEGFDINQQAREPDEPGEAASVQSPGWLPDDWIVECRPRKDGTKDKFYIESFTGRRFRSKVEVQRYLETGVVSRYKKKSKTKHDSGSEMPGSEHFFRIENSETRRPPVEQTFIPTNTTNSSTFSGEHTYRSLELPSSSASSFDNLRSMIMNGFSSAAASFSQPRPGGSSSYENSKPVFSDTWNSMLGGAPTGSNLGASVHRSSSWTNTFLNGSSSASGSGRSSSAAATSTTPHWLDRILNKPPPAGMISQPGYTSTGYGLSGNFVQSPLHYLHNAGAFENSWLNLKPPATIDHEVPWKSRSWFDKKEPAGAPRTADLLERHGLNLNHPVPDPELERYSVDHRSRDSSFYAAAAAAPSSLERLWNKGVPITLEQREYIPYSNGSRGLSRFTTEHHHQQHQQQQQQQPQHHQNQHQYQHHHHHHHQHKSDAGVRRGSSKIDKHMEKKRLEKLGASLCQRELSRLFQELKDRTKLNLKAG